ncbi:MAG: FG-GAP-like repeat-containing protein [Elusimicrobiota bacterium]
MKNLLGVLGRAFIGVLVVVSLGKFCWGSFVDVQPGVPGVIQGSLSWGDYDNDGDLDLALAGSDGPATSISKIYRNDGGSFIDINAGLTAVKACSLSWGDYDNDGDLDLALAGTTDTGSVSKIYRNDGGSFVDINAGLLGVEYCSLGWGDYDNDGDLDLALAGVVVVGAEAVDIVSKIYRNEQGNFVDVNAGLTPVGLGSLAWGDYDNDGDLDLALSGLNILRDGTSAELSKIYRNDGGSFVDTNAGLTGVAQCSLAWADYDNDGDLDLVVAGREKQSTISMSSRIYRNDSGTFKDINAGLIGVMVGGVAWGDYDNDGDLDLAISGIGMTSTSTVKNVSIIYNNSGGYFTDLQAGLSGRSYSILSWVDYDNDGDLDLALNGSGLAMSLYRNGAGGYNSVVLPPDSGFGSSYNPDNGRLELRWGTGYSTDADPGSFYYTVRVSTITPINDTNANIVSWQSVSPFLGNYPRGYIRPGQLGVQLFGLLLKNKYYWQVRTISTYLKNSSWSAEQAAYTGDFPPAPALVYPEDQKAINYSRLEFKWQAVADVESYRLQISGSADFSGILLNVYTPSVSHWVISPLDVEGKYYWRVNAQDVNGNISEWSEVRLLIVDKTAPSGKITSPVVLAEDILPGVNIAYVNSLQPSFTAEAGDQLSGVSAVFFDNSVVLSSDTVSPYQAEWGDSKLSDGTQNYFNIYIRDLAGNTTTQSILVKCDVSSPIVKIEQPAVDQAVKGLVMISGNAADVVSGIRRVDLSYLTTSYAEVFIASSTAAGHVWSCLWDTGNLDGQYTLKAAATDLAGNTAENRSNVVVDNQKPNPPVLSSPADNQYLDGSNTPLMFSWQEPSADIDFYRLQVSTINSFTQSLIDAVSPATFYLVLRDTAKSYSSLTAQGAYYWQVNAQDKAGNVSDWSLTRKFFVDPTPPSNIFQVRDGLRSDLKYTASTTILSANWYTSSDEGSGIVCYWYAIGTTAGGTDVVGWTNNGLNRSVIHRGLALKDGATYYFSVKAENGAGLQSVPTNSNGQTVDSTPPLKIAQVNDGLGADIQCTASTTTLSANWTASRDDQSGINRYIYAIGTKPGGCNVVGWTSAKLATSVTRSGLRLTAGTTYYFAVRAVNGAGLQSVSTNSNGQIVLVNSFPATGTKLLLAEINSAVAAVNNNTPELTWEPIESDELENGYSQLQLARDEDFNSLVVDTLPEGNSYRVAQPLNEGTYYWQVILLDNNDHQPLYSLPVRMIKIDLTPPGRATELAVAAGQEAGQASLTWKVSGNNGYSGNIADGKYRVKYTPENNYRFSVNDFDLEVSTALISGERQECVIAGLVSGKSYAVSLWTADEAGNWSEGAGQKFTTGPAAAMKKTNLANLVIYPNPYKPNSGLGHKAITFGGLTGRAKIIIYTLNGEKAREINKDDNNDNYLWDARNEGGESLASGVYLYRVEGENGEKKTGKFAVIK